MADSPLILITADGSARYERTREGKDALVNRFNEAEDLLLFSWAGQWKTDVFRLSRAGLDKFYGFPQKKTTAYL
jgi:hypothetical protein